MSVPTHYHNSHQCSPLDSPSSVSTPGSSVSSSRSHRAPSPPPPDSPRPPSSVSTSCSSPASHLSPSPLSPPFQTCL